MLIKGMTPQEIRVLQEFRRIGVKTMELSAIKAIRHPTGGGEAPAWSLVEKGYLSAGPERDKFALTPQADEFLAIDAKPLFEQGGAETEE
jgi:hypothetical protein